MYVACLCPFYEESKSSVGRESKKAPENLKVSHSQKQQRTLCVHERNMLSFVLPFTTTHVQTSTYLICVCLFSISFLVFLNATVSFVITDRIGQKTRVGDAVGTLGFADELIVLIACPIWGVLSDRIGLRTIAVGGYVIVGIALMVFVQPTRVYPDLLLARIFFALGAAAT